ncbi:unnamed protein product [Prunus armeniaca]
MIPAPSFPARPKPAGYASRFLLRGRGHCPEYSHLTLPGPSHWPHGFRRVLERKLPPLSLRGFDHNPGPRPGLGTGAIDLHGPVVFFHVGHADLNLQLPLLPLNRVVGQEIDQCLAFDRLLGYILEGEFGQWHRPFPDPAAYDRPSKHVFDEVGLGDDLNDRRKHIMAQLGGREIKRQA